jgi:hypothetical protein
MTRLGLVAAIAVGGGAFVACKRVQPGIRCGCPPPSGRFTAAAWCSSTFTAAVGLGPLFNASGCAECHEEPVVGGVGDEVERHAAVFHPERTGFACDQLPNQGGPVFQDSVTPALHAALGIDREALPPGVTTVAARTTPDTGVWAPRRRLRLYHPRVCGSR